MPKNLVIVESPAKAKTIEGYLGKDYKVVSSYGHVRDLPKGNNAIDIASGFTPTYEVISDKKKIIAELKKLSKASETIYLASDDDREGEAISWHLKEVLKLDNTKTKRIVFREITKNAITKAIQNPRGIDINLVNSQQARRVLDRLVGFELSPILWKKIKTGLSAGRVQSVAVRIVVNREREIDKFTSKAFFKITAHFDLGNGKILTAELPGKFNTKAEAEEFLNTCNHATFSIKDLQKKPAKKFPAPPFTTSTLQQEASRKLGFSVYQTMVVAQKLYEAGKISYMRTDSINLSQEAINGAATEISNTYGNNFVQTRVFNTKSSNAQEAHEAIRPTNFSRTNAGNDRNQKRLYELIWKRAIASQMADAQLEKTTATIGISSTPETLIAFGEVVKFEGFLKIYTESFDEEDTNEEQKGMLPPLTIGQILSLKEMLAKEGFSRHPPRYTEASLVKKLEEMGIGRPSTYAPTISTIQKRKYVETEHREGTERVYRVITLKNGKITLVSKTEITGVEKRKLFPTNIAMVVTDFLVEHFPNVSNFSFTADVEKKFDEIAKGEKVWNKMIDAFYTDFHNKVEATNQIDRKNIETSRELGIDPKTKKKVIARLGKFGPLVQLGETPENKESEKPIFASLKKGQFIEQITLEQALELFKLPRTIGEYKGDKITAAIGRFGAYLKLNKLFVSIPKEEDILDITLDRAIQLIEIKKEEEANKYIKTWDENPDIQVINGRYGPYIKAGKKNVKIPKEKDPGTLTLEECIELVEKAPEKKGRWKKK